ncbi:MAG: hypothetical protein WCS22_04785 [Acholeplasmataceae bacterium]
MASCAPLSQVNVAPSTLTTSPTAKSMFSAFLPVILSAIAPEASSIENELYGPTFVTIP